MLRALVVTILQLVQAGVAPCDVSCCGGAFPATTEWKSRVSPTGLIASENCAAWTTQSSEVYLQLKDSVNCGGDCEKAAQALAFSTITFPTRTRVLMTPHGNGRPWWEDVEVYVDGKLVHKFEFGSGKMPTECNSEEVVLEPARTTVEAGKHLFEVQVTTGDPLFHKAGHLSVTFSDTTATSCDELCSCAGRTVSNATLDNTSSTVTQISSNVTLSLISSNLQAKQKTQSRHVRRVAVTALGDLSLSVDGSPHSSADVHNR